MPPRHQNLPRRSRRRDHGVVVVPHLSATGRRGYRIGFPAPGEWTCVFNFDAFDDQLSTDLVARADGYDRLPASAEIAIGGYTVLIYARQE